MAPRVDGERVRYLGSVGPEQRSELLGSARALLHPIAFDEPFGLSVVEAMAAGTPVIAYARGSMPEIIDHGRTGFLVTDPAGAAAAVDATADLDRAAIRHVAERRFSAERMIQRLPRGLRIASQLRQRAADECLAPGRRQVVRVTMPKS